ncbi:MULTISPECIES: LysR family transcriptional regulator [Cupriavidus]
MNITLKQLRAFCAVYELRNFTLAAEAMHLTQSAVSKLCADLESETGVRLFERSTRRVVPLDAAADLYRYAQQMLGTLRSAQRSLQSLRGLECGTVSLTCSPMMAFGLLRPVIAGFAARYPGIQIDLQELSTDQSIESVRIGQCDFALVSIGELDAQMESRVVRREPICVACAKTHPLASCKSAGWKRIVEHRHITIRSVYSFRRTVDRILSRHRLSLRSSIQVATLTSALGLVSENLGILLIPGYASGFARQLGLAIVPIAAADRQLHEISLLTRRDAEPTIAAAAFIAEMERQFGAAARQDAAAH